MTTTIPTLLALDFDGVVCDGLIEYFQTAWRTYCEIWSPPSQTPTANLADRFYRLRPVIETGWEMPVLIRSLLLGIPEEKILHDWPAIAQQLLKEGGLVAADIGAKLDQVRDEWISTDLANWLGQHRFYPGVVERLQWLVSSPVRLTIISTKEGRFVQQLLQQQDISLPQECIIGKESKRPKYVVLQELIKLATASSLLSLWFVEDRLKTLQSVKQQADLDSVKLFLADWGYNTPSERKAADDDPRIQLLSLSLFAQDFSVWPQ